MQLSQTKTGSTQPLYLWDATLFYFILTKLSSHNTSLDKQSQMLSNLNNGGDITGDKMKDQADAIKAFNRNFTLGVVLYVFSIGWMLNSGNDPRGYWFPTVLVGNEMGLFTNFALRYLQVTLAKKLKPFSVIALASTVASKSFTVSRSSQSTVASDTSSPSPSTSRKVAVSTSSTSSSTVSPSPPSSSRKISFDISSSTSSSSSVGRRSTNYSSGAYSSGDSTVESTVESTVAVE